MIESHYNRLRINSTKAIKNPKKAEAKGRL